ncbi:hypothetical protein [Flavobacterium notoginsengisoli]|uniref:hypothetical protein n=1 Tax=Flavobacterium notoginsengisoli TaxID=1478199 RepID=UPI00362AD193
MEDLYFSIDKDAKNFSLKLQSKSWELNIHGWNFEIDLLQDLFKTNWADRKTIKVGKSANASAYWTIERENVIIMIGNDDETWDFAIIISYQILNEIIEKFYSI